MDGSSYEGQRGPTGLSVYVVKSGTKVRRLLPRIDLVEHTPAGTFECGFKGFGSSQLALALLADHLQDDREALKLHLAFRDDVIVDLKRDRDWCLTDDYIAMRLSALRASRTQEQKPPLLNHA